MMGIGKKLDFGASVLRGVPAFATAMQSHLFRPEAKAAAEPVARPMIRTPYLLFLGDAPDALAAKVAQGIRDWRPENAVGQIRLPGCKANLGLADMTLEEARSAGAQTLVIGVANRGGTMPPAWIEVLGQALRAGYDLASGLHTLLRDQPALVEIAEAEGRVLHDVRVPPTQYPIADGRKRAGKRCLAVGTDCSIGKMYTSLAIEAELHKRGVKADFRATGQTGIFIAERGIAIDAVIADFISGAAEWLSPDNDPDHWDIIEGQGSLFHAAFSGVTVGLIHGAQPDAMVLCHEPTRTHMRGLKHAPIPRLEDCFRPYVSLATLTNPGAQFVGICIDTHLLEPHLAERYLKEHEDKLGLPCVDPLTTGVGPIVDRLAVL